MYYFFIIFLIKYIYLFLNINIIGIIISKYIILKNYTSFFYLLIIVLQINIYNGNNQIHFNFNNYKIFIFLFLQKLIFILKTNSIYIN